MHHSKIACLQCSEEQKTKSFIVKIFLVFLIDKPKFRETARFVTSENWNSTELVLSVPYLTRVKVSSSTLI